MLIADGGGSAPYRLHPPVPSPVPKPTPTPRPHSLDAGPRPTLKTPQVDPRILRAEGISRTQLLEQQAAAHQREAVAEQQRAQQARQRADESQQQAQVADARSRESGSKEDKTLAEQWRKQARDDELNALRCEADANFTGKQAALEKSKLKDMQEGHASEPSRETQAAQVEADSAASTVSLLYDTPPGEADPLKAAGQTTHQLAKTKKWGEWQDATQQEIRLAGLRALAKGEDPQAAMRERAKTIEHRDVDGMPFTVSDDKGKPTHVSGGDLVQAQRDIALAEDPSQAALNTEFDASQKAWQPLIDAAAKKATQADDQVKADKKALADAPGGLKRDYMDGLNTSRQAAAAAGENLHWWESRKDVADNGYQQRQVDLNVHRTEVDYQVAVVTGDPKSSKDQTAIADAKDARDRALGDQVLVQDQGKSLADGVTVLDDKADLKDAWDTYYDQSASQVQPRTVTYNRGTGKEHTQTVYPEGYDKTFWAVPGSEEGKNVHRGDDGKYYYVSSKRGGPSGKEMETDRQELNPAAARVWAAHDQLNGRKDHGPAQEGSLARQKQADSDYAATKELLGSNGQVPGKLDPAYWERRAGEIEKDLHDAKGGVTDAQRAMANAQTYGGSNVDDDPLVAAVGDKVRIRDQAQLQADALHAVQQWRASPGDKKLLDAAGKAVAKAGNPQAVSKDPVADLRADRDQALQDKTGFKKTADQPGDGQQAALDKISRLDLQIKHDNNLIAQAEAGNQRTGALYLNSQFSFGDKAMPGTEGDVRFAQLEDADGYPSGMDVAPPLNYEDLMSKATMDGDDKVLGDSGIRILHEDMGLKDVWEVPLGGGMKRYIYQRDGQVFSTNTLAVPGERLSAPTEELWQRLWKADAKVETTDKAVADSTTQVGNWNQLNPGDPILAPGEKAAAGQAPAQPPAPPGLDGKPVKVPTLWDGDLDTRRDDLLAQQRALHGSTGPGEQMPEVTGMLQAELDTVIAMKDAQDAHRALQQWKSSQGPNATEESGKGKELRQAVSDAEDAAIDKKDKWLAQCRSHGLDAAKDQRSIAQARHQEWKDSHPALVGTEAERSTDSWAAWQQAEGTVGGLQQQHIQAATPAAWAAQKALIDDHLPVGQRQDTGELHDLFMANPEVMAQPLINEHYLEYGGGPLQLEGRTHLNNEVSSALGFTPDSPLDPSTPESNEQGRRHSDLYSGLSGSQKKSRDAVADEIAGIGGDQAKVTLLPVVYSTPQSGVVKTTLFKVEDGHGGAKFVDERGAHYKDLDDYRANNALPSTDCNIVMPASDKLELDSLGNVKLRVLDARTETGWETFKRRSHFDTIVGGASVVLGVVMTVGSGGMLAPVAAGLLVAASAYGATTSIMSLSNRSSHGLSVNPFTDREARLDWLNLAGSVLAVPTLSAATRAGVVAWQATRAAKNAGEITGRMSWLAIRGSKQTGAALERMAKAGGPEGAQAAALQNKMAFWSAPARVMAKPTMAVGGLGLEENTRYMADNWTSMSSDQRWEQGGMTLLNLVDFASPVLVKGVQAGRQGARGPAGSEPAAPVLPRQPVPDVDTQAFGSLPDAPLPAAAGPYRVGAAKETKFGAPVTDAEDNVVAYIRKEVIGLRFVDKDGVELSPHRVDELQRNGPLWPRGEPAEQPPGARRVRVPLGPDEAPVNHVHLTEGGIVFREGPYKKKARTRDLSVDEINAWMGASQKQGADTIAKVLNSTKGLQIGDGPAKGIAVLDLSNDVRALLAQSIRTGQGGTAAGAGGAPVAVAFASGETRRIGLVAPRTRSVTPGPAEVGRYIPRRASPEPGVVGQPRLWEAEHAFFEAAGQALHDHAKQQGLAPAQIEGSINVYVDRTICDSCKSVSAQFQREFPGIKVSVKSTGPDGVASHSTEPQGVAPDDPGSASPPARFGLLRRQAARLVPLGPRAQGPGAADRLVLPGGIAVSHGGMHPDAVQINPAGGRENCVSSAVTYDRIRHNPDLELGAVRSRPETLARVTELYGGRAALQARGSRDVAGAPAAQRYLASLPEGTRGFLTLSPPRTAAHASTGHVVNFEILPGGRVEIVDAQAGRLVQRFEAPRVGVMVTHRPGMETVNPSSVVVGGVRLANHLAVAPRLVPGRDPAVGPGGDVYGALFDRRAEPWPALGSAATSRATSTSSAGQTATGSSTPIDTDSEVFDPSITVRPAYQGAKNPPSKQSLGWKNFDKGASADQKAQLDYLTTGHSPDGNAALQTHVGKRFLQWHKNWAGGFIGRRDDVGVIYVSRVDLTPHAAIKEGAIKLDADTQVHGSFEQAKARTQAMLAKAQAEGQPAPAAWVFRMVGHEQVLAKGLRETSFPADTIDGAVLVPDKGDFHRVSWANRNAAYAPEPGDTFFKPAEAPSRGKRAWLMGGAAAFTAGSATLVTYLGHKYAGGGHDWKPTLELLGHWALGATAYRATAATGRWIAATRLDQRVENLHDLLQSTGPRGHSWVSGLNTLQRQLTGLRGAARGIAHHDRLNYHRAIEGLRANPTDPQFYAILLTAKDKVLSPYSVLGRTHLAVRIASFAFSNASAASSVGSSTVGAVGKTTSAASITSNGSWAVQNTAHNTALVAGRDFKRPSPGAQVKTYDARALGRWANNRFMQGLSLRHLTVHDGTLPNPEPNGSPLPMVKPPWSMRLKQYAARLDQLGMLTTLGAVDGWHAINAFSSGHPAAGALEVGRMAFDGLLVRAFQKDRIDESRGNRGMGGVVYQTRNPFLKWLNAPLRGAVEFSATNPATDRVKQAGLSAMVLLGAGAAGRVVMSLVAPWDEDNGKSAQTPQGPGAGPSATPSTTPSATPSVTPSATSSAPASTPSPSVSQAPSSSAPPWRRRYPPNLLP